jgi:hypothetical protein
MNQTATFDLWMSQGAQDAILLVLNFLTSKWQSKHVTIGLFDANKGLRCWCCCTTERDS